ncbi:MAG: M14 family zinc carboxypeptidase [bacterium]
MEVKIEMMDNRSLFTLFVVIILLCSMSYILAEQSNKTSWIRIYVTYPEEVNYILSEGFDVCSGKAGEYLDVLVNSDELRRIIERGYAYDILLDDMGTLGPGSLGYANYHNYNELTTDLETLEQTYPEIAKLYNLGQGWVKSGNIWGLRVSDNVSKDVGSVESEPGLLLVGVHHAREPMTCEIVLNDAKKLCELYATDSLIKKSVDNFEIWLVPVINVDGWIYDDVENYRRMWRKNGRDNNNDNQSFTSYDGVDLNRNYSYMWGYDNYGSSPTPSNETYRGPSAFSEPETQIIRDLADLYEFKVGVSYHSYGEYIIMPWGYKDAYPEGEDYNTYRTIFTGMNDAIYQYYGRRYTTGNTYDTVGYPANGVFDDWGYGETNVSGYGTKHIFAFTFEVNRSSQGGFYPSDTYIPQTTETHWRALRWLLEWMLNTYVTDISVLYFKGISTDSGVKLSWDATSDDEKIEGFNIYRREILDSLSAERLDQTNDYFKLNNELITGHRPYSYLDTTVSLNKKYEYRLEVITGNEGYNSSYTQVNTSNQVPISLEKVYPNPVSDNLHIGLLAGEAVNIDINIYDVSGRKVDSITSANLVEGYNIVDLDTTMLSNGVYSFIITSDRANLSSRFCVLK